MNTHTTSADIAALEKAVDQITAATGGILDADAAADVPDEAIAGALYAAARLFAAKKDKISDLEWPIAADALTATETVVLVAALLDAADVNIFDMAIWYRRV